MAGKIVQSRLFFSGPILKAHVYRDKSASLDEDIFEALVHDIHAEMLE